MDPVIVPRVLLHDLAGNTLVLRRQNSRHGNGKLHLPGGKHERGTIADTLVEECEQELGLTIGELLASANDFWYLGRFAPVRSEHNGKVYQEFFFDARTSDLSALPFRPNEESSGWMLVDKDTYKEHAYAFNHDVIIALGYDDKEHLFRHYADRAEEGEFFSTQQALQALPIRSELVRRSQTLRMKLTGTIETNERALEELESLASTLTTPKYIPPPPQRARG